VSTFWLGVLFVHLVAMAFFVGGQIMLAATIVPVERRNPDPARMRTIARRFGYGSLVALALLLATGIAMASRYNLWEVGTLHLKLALVGLVIVLTFAHMRFPRAHALSAVIFLITLAIVWLGIDLGR
jgi:putative copper export protein